MAPGFVKLYTPGFVRSVGGWVGWLVRGGIDHEFFLVGQTHHSTPNTYTHTYIRTPQTHNKDDAKRDARTGELALRHGEGDGEEVGEDGHGVGHVHHLVVLHDLRHEVARVQVLVGCCFCCCCWGGEGFREGYVERACWRDGVFLEGGSGGGALSSLSSAYR
jgi:hypothetical protein